MLTVYSINPHDRIRCAHSYLFWATSHMHDRDDVGALAYANTPGEAFDTLLAWLAHDPPATIFDDDRWGLVCEDPVRAAVVALAKDGGVVLSRA
jgi:hypothetical protein